MTDEIVRVACAALVRSGQVLLAHRHPQRRWYPDCWDLVGGHIEAGETPLEALRRECLEEIGVRVQDPTPIEFTLGDPFVDMSAFLVTDWEGSPVNRAPDEHDALRWFSAGELSALTFADPAALPDLIALLAPRTTPAGRSPARPPR